MPKGVLVPLLAAVMAMAGAGAASAAAASPPAVHGAALAGQGELALVRNGVLYLGGGASGGVRAIAAPGTASFPQWSHDGRWLAYTLLARNGASQLWVVRSNGADNHRVPIGPASLDVAATAGGPVWSPAADTLATAASTQRGASAGLWVASPAGSRLAVRDARGHIVHPVRPIDLVADGYGPRWSPDGKRLAYSVTFAAKGYAGASDALYTRALTGAPVRHLVARQGGILVASWWPDGKGLLYWPDPQHSASIAADGLSLTTLDLASGKTEYLATTLAYGAWITWGPGDMVAIVAGNERMAWTNKVVMQCDARIPLQAAQSCVTVTRPGGPLSLDPAWSATGGLAFVEARDLGPRGFGTTAGFDAWSRTRSLWLIAPGKAARRMTVAGVGIRQPVWSADGKRLLVVKGSSAYLVDPARATSIEVASGFTAPLAPQGYFGYVDWAGALAWSATAPA